MRPGRQSPDSAELSDIECEDCGDLIPLKRVVAVQATTCVPCMEDREADGRGTKRHRMDYKITTHGDDIEAIDQFIVREDEE